MKVAELFRSLHDVERLHLNLILDCAGRRPGYAHTLIDESTVRMMAMADAGLGVDRDLAPAPTSRAHLRLAAE